jgi:uncharacterized protein YjbI with pentapeptide repeats
MSGALGAVIAISALLYWIVQASIELEIPEAFAQWYRQPGNPVRFHTWLLSLIGVTVTLFSTDGSLLIDLRTEAIGIAITVIVLEELGRHRSSLEEKERIIRQMASHSNDFALDAVRIARENNWHIDGSLCGKILVSANLQNANFNYADLQRINLTNANLQGAELYQANLKNSCLDVANLQDSYLVGSDLREAHLVCAIMKDANLSHAALNSAILMGADFQGANLQEANLQGADLQGTDLLGANLSGSNLKDISYRAETRWPDGFDPMTILGGNLILGFESEHEGFIMRSRQ